MATVVINISAYVAPAQYIAIQLAFYPSSDVCDKTKASYQISTATFTASSLIYNTNNSIAAEGWYSDGANKGYWNGIVIGHFGVCVAKAAPVVNTSSITLVEEVEAVSKCNSYITLKVTPDGATRILIEGFFQGLAKYLDPGMTPVSTNTKIFANLDTTLSVVTNYTFGIDSYRDSSVNPYSSSISVSLFDVTTGALLASYSFSRSHTGTLC